MAKLYWKDVEIGDPIPPLAKPALSRAAIVVFSVRAGETGPLHIDEDFARQAGFGSISAPGLYGMAVATEMLENAIENGGVLSVATRFQKLIWPGDTLTAKGVVVRKYEQDKQHRVDCDVWVQNQANDIVVKGTAVCALFVDAADERKKKGRHDETTVHLGPMPKPVQIATEAMRAAHAASEAKARRPIPAGAPPPSSRPAAPRVAPAAAAPAGKKPQPAPAARPAQAKKVEPAKKPATPVKPAPAKKAAPAKKPAAAAKPATVKRAPPVKKPAPPAKATLATKPTPTKKPAPVKAAPATKPAPTRKPALAKPAPAKKPALTKKSAPAKKAAPAKKR